MTISRLALSRQHESRNSALVVQGFHFLTVIVVPLPAEELIWNSSINRRTPGSPIPRLPDVEYPSCSACRTSAIPGPRSDALTWMPLREHELSVCSVIRPLPA